MPITFTVPLSEKDWREDFTGWYCSALSIPSAEVTELRAKGEEQDKMFYSVKSDHQIVQWTKKPRPERVLVTIKIVKDLSPTEKVIEARDTATKETEEKWKYRAIIAQVIGTVLTAFITAFTTIYVISLSGGGGGNLNANRMPTDSNVEHKKPTPTPKVRLIFPENNLTLEQIREITARDQKARVEFQENCKSTLIPNSPVTTANATLYGNDVKDFFETSIKPRSSNNSFCVIEIKKDNSYEISCKPCEQ